MIDRTLHRAVAIYGRSLRDVSFQRVLGHLGVGEDLVRVALAETTIEEFCKVFPDITTRPLIVIDADRGRVARLDFYHGSGSMGVDVNATTDFGMLVDTVCALHRDVSAELLEACVHAQTREFDFA